MGHIIDNLEDWPNSYMLFFKPGKLRSIQQMLMCVNAGVHDGWPFNKVWEHLLSRLVNAVQIKLSDYSV